MTQIPRKVLKFQVRRNIKRNSNIDGDWIVIDPNGLLHEDCFYNKQHAIGRCAELNIALAKNQSLAMAI